MSHDRHRRTAILGSVLTALLVMTLLLSAYGGWFDPSRTGPFPALAVLAYPAVVLLSAVLLVVLMISRRWRSGAAVGMALLATLPALRTVCPVNRMESLPSQETTLTLLHWNVAGWDSCGTIIRGRENDNMRQILDSGADLVALVEPTNHGWDYDKTPSTLGMREEIDSIYPFRSHGNHNGVALLSRYPFHEVRISKPVESFQYLGYILTTYNDMAYDVQLPTGDSVRVIVAYMPSFKLDKAQRKVFTDPADAVGGSLLKKLSDAFDARAVRSRQLRRVIDQSCRNVIVCCDLNDVPSSYAHRTLMGGDMHDTFADAGCGYTPTYHANGMLFHLDHVLFRGGKLRLTGYRRLPRALSDHSPILVSWAVGQ